MRKKKMLYPILFLMIFINIIALNPKMAKAMCVKDGGFSGLGDDFVEDVFIGKVLEVQHGESKNNIIFKVEKTLKGEQENVISFTTPSRGDGVFPYEHSFDFNFEKGKRYKVYARTSQGSLYTDDCFGNTREISLTSTDSIAKIIGLIILLLIIFRSSRLVFTKNKQKKLSKAGLIMIGFYFFAVSIIFIYVNLYIDSGFFYWLVYIIVFLPLNIIIIDWFKHFFHAPLASPRAEK